ncbi:MAG: murein biosynthesis integral membrane protein MurJ [Candidatus Moranbacteria bacterium]|nr:murein biosynthesis integral membrane protein MurJ [Candidatus Moranbacteria bacterium]
MIKSIKQKFLNSAPSNSVASAAFVIAIAGILSRVLGLFRDRILASHFGAGDTLDIYYAAFRVPDLIYNLLILGALSAAFIPVFTSLIAKDEEKEAWELVNVFLTTALIFLIVIAAIFALFAPQLMKLITPGFPADKLQGVASLTRIMFLSPIFLGISGIFGGILNSFKRFLIYSLAPIMYNLGIIFGAVFLVKPFGIAGLAWGVVIGAFFHMLVQYPNVKMVGLKYFPHLNFKNKNLRKVITLMIPRTMGLAVTQINLLIVTIIASTLASGSISIFNFANNLQSFPIGIFAIPFALAVFPILSHHAARDEQNVFIHNFSKTFRQILFFIIPASILILVLRAQIVRIVLGAGKFDWQDTILTFQALGIFSVSLFAQATIPLLARAFYALHNTRVPFLAGIGGEAMNLAAALILSRYYGILGLVWAFSLSSIVEMFLLIFILRNKLDYLDDKKIISVIFKISLSALAAGLVAQLAKYLINPYVNLDTFLGVFWQMAFAGTLGTGSFLILAHFFDLEELRYIKKLFSTRIFRLRPPLPEDPTEASGI